MVPGTDHEKFTKFRDYNSFIYDRLSNTTNTIYFIIKIIF